MTKTHDSGWIARSMLQVLMEDYLGWSWKEVQCGDDYEYHGTCGTESVRVYSRCGRGGMAGDDILPPAYYVRTKYGTKLLSLWHGGD